eukprot:gene20115-7182_t
MHDRKATHRQYVREAVRTAHAEYGRQIECLGGSSRLLWEATLAELISTYQTKTAI